MLRSHLLPLVTISLVMTSPALAQDDPADRLDSIMRSREDLFDRRLDTLHEETPPPESPDPVMWAPEFSPQFTRKDLLGLRDRRFFLSYDRADGLFLGVGADLPRSIVRSSRINAHLGGGYSFGSHYWQVTGGARIDVASEEAPLRIGVDGHIFTDTRDAWKMDRVENTLFAALAGGDARDYFQRRGFSASLEQFITSRSTVAVEYRYDHYRSSRREVGWSLFGPEQPFREVMPVNEGPMHSVVGTVVADLMSLRSWTQPQIGVAVQAEFGWGEDIAVTESTGEQDAYGFQSFVVDARLKTTLVSNLLHHALRLRAGASTGEAPRQRWFSIGGAGTLPGYPQNEYWGDRMMIVQSELLVQPISSGFGRNLRIILTNDFGTAHFADSTDRDNPLALGPRSISDWKYSPGIYLGSNAGRFRIGVAWRTDVMEPPQFVLRVSEVF